MNSPRSTYFEFWTVKQRGEREEFRDFFYGEDHVRGSSPGSSSSSPAAEIVYQTVRREIYAGPNSREAFVSREVTLFCFPHPISWKRTKTEKQGVLFRPKRFPLLRQLQFFLRFFRRLRKLDFFPLKILNDFRINLRIRPKLMGAWIRRTRKPLPWIHSVWKLPKISHFNNTVIINQNWPFCHF